jgi:DnaJ-class molecular chaperone
MKTPYELLAVTASSTDAEIKLAYLQLVKLNPPDRDQAKFQQLHSAYETIKNATEREKYALFNYPEADFNALLDQAFMDLQPSLMSADCFEQLLRVSIDDNTFLTGNPDKIRA